MAIQTRGRSARMERAYDKISTEYGRPTGVTFSANGVYDKLAMLVLLALLTGAVGYATDSAAFFVVGLIGGLVCALVGFFKPAMAHIMAPLYALFEGLGLGALTAAYASQSNGIAPLAIIFTGGIFVGALIIFRTGLVKVTPRFMAMTLMASVGFILVAIGGMLGLFPGLSSQTGLLVFGVIGVFIGVAYLFIDFNYVQIGEQRQLPVEGEWYAALMLMTSLVFVYINVLRVLASRRR
jgi:uncharacterized YccA/Bax inhibitor family protein